MKSRLQTYPPLGQVTVVTSGLDRLDAVLEIPERLVHRKWDILLWHSTDGQRWQEAMLTEVPEGEDFVCLQNESSTSVRRCFTLSLSFTVEIDFTIKIRQHGQQAWLWARDEFGLGDGRIVRPSDDSLPDLHDAIPDLSNEWKTTALRSQVRNTSLWALETSVLGATNDVSSFTNVVLGSPWGGFSRWFALVRHLAPWLAPRHGYDRFSLDKDGVIASFLSHQGNSIVLLPVSGLGSSTTVLHHTKSHAVAINVRNDDWKEQTCTVLVSVGHDFEEAVAAVMHHARSMLQTQAESNASAEMKKVEQNPKPQWMENWYDGLGFCTWNALGRELTSLKLLQALDRLERSGISISNLIIDDNWQTLDDSNKKNDAPGWADFEADPASFPHGLKSTVSDIRKRHPKIKHIAVWHALLGYWGGLAPDGKLAKSYKTIELEQQDGSFVTVIDRDDLSRFFNDFYLFLTASGIDGVKTDAQVMLDAWKSASARRELTNAYLDAWTIASLRHFSFKVISCMSQFPQAMFHSHMAQNHVPLVVRNSDDFFPNVPASHTWHIWANAHNSIFSQYLNVLPDWDIFQTVHQFAELHAAARCVSGGPIYITDEPGQHNLHIIKQMTAQTSKGETIVLRPGVIGRSIRPYTAFDSNTALLQVGSYHGRAETGTSILGVFNVAEFPVTEIIPLSTFRGVVTTGTYVVQAHTSGKVSAAMTLNGQPSQVVASLDVDSFEIYCAFPLTAVQGRVNDQIYVANLGLVGKMTGCAAVVANDIAKLENGRIALFTKLKALGTLGVYISSLPHMTILKDFMITVLGTPIPVETVSISRNNDVVLLVDVAKAWELLGLNSGWSNEVEVKIYFDGRDS